jgi:hypothetical protein
MAAPWIAELLDHADRRLLAGGYAGVSVDTAAVRRWLDALRWPYLHPDRPAPPAMDIEATALRTIAMTRRRSMLFAAAAGLAGLWAVPPEVAGTAVSTLRLGQRLAVVYGFDPETDRGRMALWRALAGALELDLPQDGPVGIRLSDVPGLVKPGLAPRNVALWLVRALLARSARQVAGVGRLVPVLASGTGAWSASRRTNDLGTRMCTIYRRIAENADLPGVSDAEEVAVPDP